MQFYASDVAFEAISRDATLRARCVHSLLRLALALVDAVAADQSLIRFLRLLLLIYLINY